MITIHVRRETHDSRRPRITISPAQSQSDQACSTDNCTGCEDLECNRDLFDQVVAWEQGRTSDEGTLRLFQKLVDTGLAWTHTGAVRRTAALLLREGAINRYQEPTT